MPWSAGDAPRFKKNLGSQGSQKWANIANSVLSESGDEGKAIRIANSATKGAVERRLRRNTGG